MDGRMLKGLPRLEDVPRSDPSCYEFSINTRRRKSAKARVIYKQSIEESERAIFVNRKASLRANNNFQEAMALLSGLYNQCNDEPSAQKSHE